MKNENEGASCENWTWETPGIVRENHLKLRPTSEDIDYIESMADSDSTEKYKGLKDELLGTFTQTAYCDFVWNTGKGRGSKNFFRSLELDYTV